MFGNILSSFGQCIESCLENDISGVQEFQKHTLSMNHFMMTYQTIAHGNVGIALERV